MKFRRQFALVALAGAFCLAPQAAAQVSFYETSSMGYLCSPKATAAGIAVTTDAANSINIVRDGVLVPLVKSPGAGMYTTVSPDGRTIGFKSINAAADQAPALLDVTTGAVTLLEDYTDQCGQVSIAADGTLAYTMGNTLVVRKGDSRRTFDLGAYYNIANISPDSRTVAFGDIDSSLFMLDTQSGRITRTAAAAAYNPLWSPDGSLLAVQQADGRAFTLDRATGRTFDLGEAASISWTPDSRSLVFTRAERINDFEVSGASVIMAAADGSSATRLIDGSADCPVGVTVSGDSYVVSYATGAARGLESRRLTAHSDRRNAPASVKSLISIPSSSRITDTSSSMLKATSRSDAPAGDGLASRRAPRRSNDIGILDIPYINQVWDTPASYSGAYGWGYVCCAPSCSCMLLAYYGVLEPHDVPSRSQYAKVNPCKFSWYVGRDYVSVTGFNFNIRETSRNVSGGYGFMWYDNWSPYSHMADFYKLNGCEDAYLENSYSALVRECKANRPYTLCLQNGTGGHVVLAFLGDMQAAMNGSGTWEKKGSFVCHDPYGDYNNGYPNWDGRYSTYDMVGYNNGVKNIGVFYWGCVTQPPRSFGEEGIYCEEHESLQFFCHKGETPAISLRIKGTKLAQDITVESSHPEVFALSTASLGADGGTVTVTMKQTAQVGTYGPGGSVDNSDFAVTFTSGQNKLVIPVSAEVKGELMEPLTEMWNVSSRAGNTADVGYEATKIRNIAYSEGKLYCVHNNKEILVLNASDGSRLGTLLMTDEVAGGVYALSDVKVASDGSILACNCTNTSKKIDLRIYRWADDNAQPEVLLSTSDFGGLSRIGDAMEIVGSPQTTLKAVFVQDNSSNTRIAEYTLADGVWSAAVTTMAFDDADRQFKTGSNARAIPGEGGWWLDGNTCMPTWVELKSDGRAVATSRSCSTENTWGNGHCVFSYGDNEYAANLVFVGTANYADGALRISANDDNNFTMLSHIGIYPSEGLGATRNTSATGGVAVDTDGSTYVRGFVASTAQGLACYSMGKVPEFTLAPVGSDGVESVTVDNAAAAVRYFNLHGMEVSGSNLAPGIYVRVQGRTATKTVVR